MWKADSLEKNSDAEKDWGPEEKRVTEDEMVGWHHQLNEHKFEQAPGDREGQRSLACCSLWGHKESDMTKWLNNNKNIDEPWKHYAEWNKQDTKEQILYDSTHMRSLQ